MTSSIFLPRRSRAWPEPRTHLMESTMFVFPEPLGPTIAVTPPSKRISVDRAKVLNPNRLSDCRNKGRFTVADVVPNRLLPTTPGFLLDRGSELAAARRLRGRFDAAVALRLRLGLGLGHHGQHDVGFGSDHRLPVGDRRIALGRALGAPAGSRPGHPR